MQFKSQPACNPLPAHAHRACTTEDPCSCTCDSGFIKSGGECVCPPPNSVCNGVCGYFPHVSRVSDAYSLLLTRFPFLRAAVAVHHLFLAHSKNAQLRNSRLPTLKHTAVTNEFVVFLVTLTVLLNALTLKLLTTAVSI